MSPVTSTGHVASLIPRDDETLVDTPFILEQFRLHKVVLFRRGRVVTLGQLVVEPAMRGTGIGSSFMDALVREADKEGLIVALTPDTCYGASSLARLRRFYRRFGFRKNTGRNINFLVNESMLRLPKRTDE